MARARFEIEKFTGENDFGLWKIKMKAILMQQGVWNVLKDGKAESSSTDKLTEKKLAKKEDMEYKAYSSLLLYLNDRVMSEVQKEETNYEVWTKLDSMYATKSVTNRLHLKQRLLEFKISDDKGLGEQLEIFGKCLDDLEAIDEAMKNEDKALMLLNALPKSFEHFKDAILLGRESKVSYEEVYSALKLKNSLYMKNVDNKKFAPIKKKFTKKLEKEKHRDFKETRSYHHCKKPGHLKKDCYAWKRKQAI